MNDDGESDDVWVELLPVQLVDAHRARFLQGGEKKQRSQHSEEKHIYIATGQPSISHLLPAYEIKNNPPNKGHLSQEHNEMKPRLCS